MRRVTAKLALVILLVPLVLSLSPVSVPAVGESRLTTGTTDQFQPDIYGDKVVWLDGDNDPYLLAKYSNVYLYNIGGASQKISSVAYAHAPAVSATGAVWEDLRNDSGEGTVNTDIWSYPLPGGPESSVTTNTGDQLMPDGSGGRTVWQDFRNGNWDIYLKDT